MQSMWDCLFVIVEFPTSYALDMHIVESFKQVKMIVS